MFKIVLLILEVLLTGIASANGPYITGGLGFDYPEPISASTPTHYGYAIYGNVTKAIGFTGEVGAGYRFAPFRLEVTYSYSQNGLVQSQAHASGIYEHANLTGSITTQTALASLYYDIKLNRPFIPYFGGGIGYGNIGQSQVTFLLPYGFGVSEPANQSVLAYRAKIGLSYIYRKDLDVFVEGIYLGTSSYAGSGGFSPGVCSMGASNDFGAKAGIRYFFL